MIKLIQTNLLFHSNNKLEQLIFLVGTNNLFGVTNNKLVETNNLLVEVHTLLVES